MDSSTALHELTYEHFLFQGDHVNIRSGQRCRVIRRGSFKQCSNTEKLLESYCLAHEGEQIDSEFLLSELSCDDEIPDVLEPQKENLRNRKVHSKIQEESRKIRILSAGTGVVAHQEIVSAGSTPETPNLERSPVVPPPTHGAMSPPVHPKKNVGLKETNRLLNVIVKQNETIVSLLTALVEDHNPVSDAPTEVEYTDHRNETFSTKDIPHNSPNLFAIAFMKRILSENDFKNCIIDPMGPSDCCPLPAEKVALLKSALSSKFRYFVFNKVRRAVNQAARDIRSREKKLSTNNQS